MDKKEELKDSFKLSYESDGEMGEKPEDNQKQKQEEPIQFFNITPESE